MILPLLGRSSVPRTWSSVLLPTPDSPTIANRSPSAKSKFSPRRTWISVSPSIKALCKSLTERRLFIANDFNRIELGGLSCRVDTGQQTHRKQRTSLQFNIDEIDTNRHSRYQIDPIRRFEGVISDQSGDAQS